MSSVFATAVPAGVPDLLPGAAVRFFAAAAAPAFSTPTLLHPAGEPDAPAPEQWAACVAPCSHLLAAAPEDEVLAEMLALQNELMQQAAVNRARLAPALQGVAASLDAQAAAAQERAQEEADVKAWIQVSWPLCTVGLSGRCQRWHACRPGS